MTSSVKQAALLGATGLVGGELLKLLLGGGEYGAVTAIVRKPLPEHAKLRQIVLDDFAQMDRHAEAAGAFAGAEDVYCCLGTTIRQAGSQERFRLVDYAYPLKAAVLAKEAGAQRYLLVSAMGANAASGIFYSRVKGELETAIRALALPMVSIVRPSLLLGNRQQFRLGERVTAAVAGPLLPLMSGRLLKYRPIEAADVAAVMYRVGQMYTPGVNVYENDQLHRMAPGSR